MSASLDTVIVFSSRMEEVAAWYRDVLGLGEWERHPGHLGQRVGPVWFGIDQRDGAVSGSGVVAWFHVPDLDATFARAEATGSGVVAVPAASPSGYRLARVKDPDGNVVGLAQKRSATS
jgi:predicted enzyme related to lactoylglutathione lyase